MPERALTEADLDEPRPVRRRWHREFEGRWVYEYREGPQTLGRVRRYGATWSADVAGKFQRFERLDDAKAFVEQEVSRA